ncbi:MAG TPA: NADPH-dependent FMN reductase [Ktedonobacteraceae bacterium]
MPTPSLQICLLGGSAEYPSRILACLNFLAQAIQAAGEVAHVWDLAQQPLPILDPRASLDPAAPGNDRLKRLTVLADQADAFVWGSPIYHNSFSGVLKNGLDSLSIQQFRHKPVALLSCGNNERTGVQPCDHLQIVARGLHAIVIPTQLVTLTTDFARGQDGYVLINEAAKTRSTRLAEELLHYAQALRLMRAGTTGVTGNAGSLSPVEKAVYLQTKEEKHGNIPLYQY